MKRSPAGHVLALLLAVPVFAACGGDDDGGGSNPDASIDREPDANQCAVGTGDCNDDLADGCETDLTLRDSCGTCGEVCEQTEWCDPGVDRGCVQPTATEVKTVNATVNAAVFDADGNLFVTGYFSGTVDFGLGDRTADGAKDVFVARYLPSGEASWVKTFGGNGDTDDSRGESVDVDADGNVYVAGHVKGTTYLGDEAQGEEHVATDFSAFLLSYDDAGTLRWGDVYPTSEAGSFGNEIRVGESRVYAVVGGGTNIDLGGGARGTTSSRRYVYIAALDQDDGGHVWSTAAIYRVLEGSSILTVFDMALDSDENVYLSGYWRVSANFGNGEIVSATPPADAPSDDGFVASYTAGAGAYRWASFVRNSYASQCASWGIAIDEEDRVFATGLFRRDTDFGEGQVEDNDSTLRRIFVAHYDSTSGDLEWLETGLNQSEMSDHWGQGIAARGGSVYVAGMVQGEVTFAGETLDTGGDSQDILVTSLTAASGEHRWTRIYGGDADDRATDILFHPDGDLAAVFQTEGTVGLDGEPLEPAGVSSHSVVRITE